VATIDSIIPNKSKRTGEVPFSIIGDNFLTQDYSSDLPGLFYSDASLNDGEIIPADYLTLSVGTQDGSLAGIDTTHSFSRSFDVSADFQHEINTLPSLHSVKIAALRSFDILNENTYSEIYLGFNDPTGYFLRVEVSVEGSIRYSTTRSIDPHNINKLRLIRSEYRITGCIEIDNELVVIGAYKTDSIPEQKIKIYAQNALTQASNSFKITLKRYEVKPIVSLYNQFASNIQLSNEEIKGTTRENEVGMGNLVVGFPDTSYIEVINGFEYIENQKMNKDVKTFDVIISVYNLYVKPSRNELFSTGGSFVWDDNYWIDPDKQNKNLYIPSLWDPTTANIPYTSIQSGYGDSENIKMIDIAKFKSNNKEFWHARINHGTFFIKNVPYYLHSSESIVLQLGENLTEDGRSYKNLKYLPKIGVPIIASTLTTNPETGLIVDRRRFKKRGKFTGIVQNGIELDTNVPSNIDKIQNEFIVHYNSNNTVKNWKVPVEGSTAGIYSFFLPKLPLKDFSVVFSRNDIFKQEKESGSFYGNPGTIYNKVFYGEPLESLGDYSVNYLTGEVSVYIDQEYFDMGYVSYTFDYPAKIEFNNNYLFNKGGGIIDPEPIDLAKMDNIGESNGMPGQTFRLAEFPVLDYTSSTYLDQKSFRLFLYDEADNTFDKDWIRVRNIKDYGPADKVYQLSSDQGIIFFGDGINGLIPQKYKKIVGGYKTTVRIEYEPASSSDYWIGADIDLNLSRNSLNAGFLYLSRKKLIPDTISVRFSTHNINALEFAELLGEVRDRDGDPVPNVELKFEIVNGNGNLEENIVRTNSEGKAKTTFIPSGSIDALGTFAHLFEPGPNENTLGEPKNDIYFSSGTILNNLLVMEQEVIDKPEDIYIFKVYDDNDAFLPYNNRERTGGVHKVYYKENDPSTSLDNELIKPKAINGKVLIFEDSLPQPFSSSEPNYEPNLRGFAVIGKKKIQAKASVDTGLFIIDSDIASLYVEYSPIQLGEWKLPTPPADYNQSEISRATYITINPDQTPNP